MSEVRRVLLANGQYIEIVQETGTSTGAVMSQNAVTTALNGKANTTHTHAASDITSGTFSSARIADGAITKAKLANDVISSLPSSSYETVVVTATVSNNQRANGLLVSINGVQYTFSSTGKVYAMIPQGQVYSVTPISSAIFNASGGGTYTASTGNRTVSVSYTVGYGVYIEDRQGKLYTRDDWSSGNNANANSVVVMTDAHSFRIALDYISSSMRMSSNSADPWDTYLSGTTNSGITNSTVAKLDYNGATNTKLIVEKCQSSTTYAAGACNAYTFPDGVTKGYLPALGELYLANQNKDAIDYSLSKCGYVSLPPYWHWSSTLYGTFNSSVHCWDLLLDSDRYSTDNLGDTNYVRAFGTY